MPFVSSVTAGSVLVPTLLPGLVGRPFGGGILVLAVKVALVVLAMGELVSAMKVALVVLAMGELVPGMVGLEVGALPPPELPPAVKGTDIFSIVISATVPLPFQRLLAPTSLTHRPYIARYSV